MQFGYEVPRLEKTGMQNDGRRILHMVGCGTMKMVHYSDVYINHIEPIDMKHLYKG